MQDLRVCFVCSSLGLQCGIANFTEDLAKSIDNNNSAEILLMNNINNFQSIQDFKPDIVNVEFEYSLYPTSDLNRLLNKLRRKGITSAITMHGWSDWSEEDNNVIDKADKIIVLNDRFKRRLIERGNSPDKISVIPMGFRKFELEDRGSVREKLKIDSDRKVVGLYGFFELWKGFDKGAKAVSILKKVYPDVLLLVKSFSKGYDMAKKAEKDFEKIVKKGGIDVLEVGRRDMYLPLDKIASILHACDVLLYPYQELFTYSSSAAIRDGISSNVPIVASDISFFKDIPTNCVLKVKTNNPRDIAIAITELFENERSYTNLNSSEKVTISDEYKNLGEQMINNQRELVEKNSWSNIGKLYIDTIRKYNR